MKKKVLLTVNPLLVESRDPSTMRKFVTALDKRFDLHVLPVSGYDFKRGRVRAFKRIKGGAFEDVGMMTPAADLWIVYSDGFYLDHRRFGFRVRRDYFNAQNEFHHRHLDAGRIRRMVNTPEAEVKGMKSWLATLDFKKTRVIPTYVFSHIDEVHDLQKRRRRIVVKPDWGGACIGVQLLADETSVVEFQRKLKRDGEDLSEYTFQEFRRGDEKRLWFAGGECVGGRRYRSRRTPWSEAGADFKLSTYDKISQNGFAADLAAARRMCELADMDVGSVDFIGDEINEINGGGTVFTVYHNNKLLVDTRPAYIKYFQRLADSL
jgi:hypothetical protein